MKKKELYEYILDEVKKRTSDPNEAVEATAQAMLILLSAIKSMSKGREEEMMESFDGLMAQIRRELVNA